MTVTVHWIPLGADGHVVARCGRAYEAVAARRSHRAPARLVHAGLTVGVDGHRYVIEQAPAWGAPAKERGVVVTGPVGLRVLGRMPLFRYEVRCWRDGMIPDLRCAIAHDTISDDEPTARRLVDLTPWVPDYTWGRRAPGTDEMWNSNAVIAWLLASTGVDSAARLPDGCRAPGWESGRMLAAPSRPPREEPRDRR
jgi:hypothetical protein